MRRGRRGAALGEGAGRCPWLGLWVRVWCNAGQQPEPSSSAVPHALVTSGLIILTLAAPLQVESGAFKGRVYAKA